MTLHSLLTSALVAALTLSAAAPANADDADITYQYIHETYGGVPSFFWRVPRADIPEAWAAFAAHQMNPDLALDGSIRELIGVAVAAQGGCQSCLYFHTAAAIANGASESDILAALGVAEATGRLHRVMAELDVAPHEFRHATDLVLWGDGATVTVRSPSAAFCSRLVAANSRFVGFCGE